MSEIRLFDAGCVKSTLDVLFGALVYERRRIDGLIERARNKDPHDPRIKRAESCGAIVDERLHKWLSRWEPAEPPN
jgi:hypothetical protein